MRGRSVHSAWRCGSNALFAGIFLVFLGFLESGCQVSQPYVKGNAAATAATANPLNCLGEGDVISIAFRYSTNFNTTQKVALDGTVNLDGAGALKVAGLTLPELEGKLTQLYREQTKDDPVTVRLVATAAAIYVAGAVIHPGKIPLDRPMTVIEAIMEAGGPDPYRAKLSDVSVLRIEDGTQVAHRVDFKRQIEGSDTTPFYLKPFDVVRVPIKAFNY